MKNGQVAASHYRFEQYVSRARWGSIWHQLNEVIKLGNGPVLEIGPGNGSFTLMARAFGLSVETLDHTTDLQPDYVGDICALPFSDQAYETVVAFQVLEHLPYDAALQGFREMVRVAGKNVVISLPDARAMWRYGFHIPGIGHREFLIPHPFQRPKTHIFDGEHYWEINKKDYDLEKIVTDFSEIAPMTRTFLAPDNTYHRFMIFQIDN